MHLDPDGQSYADKAEIGHGITSAAAQAGIRLTHLFVPYSVGGKNSAESNDGQRRFILKPEDFVDLVVGLTSTNEEDPQIRIGIAPYSVRQVPASRLAAALEGFADLAFDGPIHIHAD